MVTVDTRKGSGEPRKGSIGGGGVRVTPKSKRVSSRQSEQAEEAVSYDDRTESNLSSDSADKNSVDIGYGMEEFDEAVSQVEPISAYSSGGNAQRTAGAGRVEVDRIKSGSDALRGELHGDVKREVKHAQQHLSIEKRGSSPFSVLLPQIGVVGDLSEFRVAFGQRLDRVQASIMSEPDERAQVKAAELLMLKQVMQWLSLGDSDES